MFHPMLIGLMSHKDKVREEFTRQAEAFAGLRELHSRERIERLVNAINPAPDARALEIATGPGHVAMALAERCREVVGVDITDAPLAIAERTRRERGIANIRFQRADADQLPFGNAEFEIVLCRFAFHHFEDSAIPLREMTRVCRGGGRVAVEDLAASEIPERAEFYNRFERLRDTSHTRALPISELLRMFAAQGLEIETFYSGELVQPLERWLANSQTPPDRAAEIKSMFARDEREDLSGTHPFRRGGEIFFTQRTVAIVGRKLTREARRMEE
jgi:ubiquinone/menaquinone biosynthesis C-methylase UbiE